MNQMELARRGTHLAEIRHVIDDLTDLYSQELLKDLTAIIESDPKSINDLQLAINQLFQAGHKVNSFVNFVNTLDNISKNQP